MQRQLSMPMSEAEQKLELFISCRSLADVDTFSVSDPFVVVFVKKAGNWTEYGRTELIWNSLNPNFAKSVIFDYFFEIQQHVKFVVNHHISERESQVIGSCETTISAIAGSKDQVLMQDLSNKNKVTGKIIIRADQVKQINDDLKMTLSASQIKDTRFWFWHSTSPFLRIYRLRRDDPHPVLVHETEFVQNKLSGRWKTIEVKAQKICNGDYNMPIRVELWDYRKNGAHMYLGVTQFTVGEMRNNESVKKPREFKDKDNKLVGHLIFDEFKLMEKPSFFDFIAGGVQLNLIVAIDFTASNQNPHHPSSLHYRDPTGKLNQYQQAMVAVGEILVNYDYDKQVPVYGFGCKPRLPRINTSQTLHCFPINGNPENPEVEGLGGIMDAYQQVLLNVQFDGPTYFGPILQETMKMAAQCRDLCSDNYFILLILTDGEIHDMQASIDAIIASSHLPLSIIIVGIGNADFSNMERLDNDDLSMTDSQGRKSQRDLVQFVPYNEFKQNPELLAKNVLEELPDQLVEYMMLVNRKPNQHNQLRMEDIAMQNSIKSQQYNQQKQQPFPNQQYPPQPSPQHGQYFQPPQLQQQNSKGQGIAVQALGAGLAQNGFLKNLVNQANVPPQQQQQQYYTDQQIQQQNAQRNYQYPK